MKTSLIKHCQILALCTVGCILPAFGEPYAKGNKMEGFKVADQHGTPFEFKPAETRFLLVSGDMDTGKKANAALTTLGKDHLPSKKAVFVANIVGMPGIGRAFAIPKMRKYSHQIILGDDAGLISRFPLQEGKVTVFKIMEGKVQSIAFWTPGVDAVDDYLK